MKKSKSNIIRKVALVILSLAILCICVIATINMYVKNAGKQYILTADDASLITDVDVILILGCAVNGDSPSDMLRDRLECGIELYELGVSSKLLMSGDHGQKDYDEVGTMKMYATENGVPSEDVFMDHKGFSTYESMYRAKKIFGIDKVIIVTQSYHLYRAIYIARNLGMEAYGVASDLNEYRGQGCREVREVLARCKDFAYCLFTQKPIILGEIIDIRGDGNITNDSHFRRRECSEEVRYA